jgi:hypothetical protein
MPPLRLAILTTCWAAATLVPAAEPGDPVVLCPLYRTSATAAAGGEHHNLVNKPPAAKFNGVFIGYGLEAALPGTAPLSRHAGPGSTIKISTSAEAPPWSPPKLLAHVYTGPEHEGTVPLVRYHHPGRRDTFYTAAGEPVPEGFTPEATLGYVYPRGNGGDPLVRVEAGGVKMAFHRHYGGTLWELEYGGLAYLNIHDLGRQAQVSGRWTRGDVEHIFSECGMGEAVPFANPKDPNQRMGSVCLRAGAGPDGAFSSEAIPLEFKADTAKDMGGGVFRPVLYRGLRTRKTVTPGLGGIPGCIQWRHDIVAGPDLTGQKSYQHEIIGAHLTCVFSGHYRFDPATDRLEPRPEWDTTATGHMLRVRDCTDRCQIFSTPDKRHAFGMMFRDTAQGGSADEIIGYFWKKLAPFPQDGLGVLDNNCIALFGLRYEAFQNGSNPSTAYLFVGDFDTVRNGARALYQRRDSVPWK